MRKGHAWDIQITDYLSLQLPFFWILDIVNIEAQLKFAAGHAITSACYRFFRRNFRLTTICCI